MSLSFIDLHSHSNLSDGKYSVAEIIAQAEHPKVGIGVLALCDHNATVDLADFRLRTTIKLVQGTELSVCFEGQEFHLLGWGFDPGGMQEVFHKNKTEDCRGYIENLLASLRILGIELGTYAGFQKMYPGKEISRVHLAKEAVKRHYAKSTAEFLDLYIGDRGKRLAYLPHPPPPVTLEEGVHAIITSGGIPALAHPLAYNTDLHQLLSTFKSHCGTHPSAIEAAYGPYNSAQRAYLGELAHRYGCYISPGSDMHGWDDDRLGKYRFHKENFRPLLEALNVDDY